MQDSAVVKVRSIPGAWGLVRPRAVGRAGILAGVAQTDEELLEAWRGGDTKAGTLVFRRFFPQCRRFFVNKVAERDVEDLLQRTFTAMVESRDRFRGDASFRTFVFSIARRTLMRYLREIGQRDSKRSTDLNVSSIAMLGLSPGTKMALQQDQQQVRRALQQIPVHFQTIIELSYWEELGTAELAQILEIEPTTVRTRLFRARKALAKALEGTALAEDESVDRAVVELGASLM